GSITCLPGLAGKYRIRTQPKKIVEHLRRSDLRFRITPKSAHKNLLHRADRFLESPAMQTQQPIRLRRRTFVAGTAAIASALSTRSAVAANEKINVGFIGYGLIGKRH